ncbi:hypothetical protein LOD99_9156 [Oopsacas minuta]|uniref:Uncharacterized protein n=1 Tax=Oopsacas minuta TaxID=111878 RepID=A0AAV7JDI7_9METZ|nr:hypothetical protein LOD99_9156 [Oopsacas minuta]
MKISVTHIVLTIQVNFCGFIRSFGIRKICPIPDMTLMNEDSLKEMHLSQGIPPKGVCSGGAIFPIDSSLKGQLQRVWVLGEPKEFFEKSKAPSIKRKCMLSHALIARKSRKYSNTRDEYLYSSHSRLSKFRLGLIEYGYNVFSILNNMNEPNLYHPYDRTRRIMRKFTSIQLRSIIRVQHHGTIIVFEDQVDSLIGSRSIIQKYFAKFLHQLVLECYNRYWVKKKYMLVPFFTEISSHELSPRFLQDLELQDVLLSSKFGSNNMLVSSIGENELFELLFANVITEDGHSCHSVFNLLTSLNNKHLFRIGAGKMSPIISFLLGQLHQSYAVGILALEDGVVNSIMN